VEVRPPSASVGVGLPVALGTDERMFVVRGLALRNWTLGCPCAVIALLTGPDGDPSLIQFKAVKPGRTCAWKGSCRPRGGCCGPPSEH
jgi:hypothetical protein